MSGIDGPPRAYIVSGAGGGIGSALTKLLIASGARVAAVDFSSRRLRSLADDVSSRPNLLTIKADVSDEADAQRSIDEATGRFGQVHGLANVAGGIPQIGVGSLDLPLAEMTVEIFRSTIKLNLESVFVMSKAITPHFQGHGYGKIVNVASLAAWSNHDEMGNLAYDSAKAGVIAFSRTLARALGPSGVRCNVVAPGMVMSDRMRSLADQGIVERHLRITALKTFARPEDLGSALAYFLSPASDAVSGEVLRVAAGAR